MRVIDHRRFSASKSSARRWKRLAIRAALAVVVLFVLANIVVGLAYRGKAMPNYRLGSASVGGVSYDDLRQRLDGGNLMQKTVRLEADGKTKDVRLAELGVAADAAASIERLRQTRTWLPVLSLLSSRTVPLVLTIDDSRFDGQLSRETTGFERAVTPSHIVFKDDGFAVAEPQGGLETDKASLKAALKTAAQEGVARVGVPLRTLSAPAPADLSAELKTLQKQLDTKLSFAYAGKTITPTAAQKGAWFTTDGQTMSVSPALVGTYLDTIAAGAANRSDLGLAIRYAMAGQLASDLVVVPAGKAVRTYCTSSRNVTGADLDGLIGKLALTYADVRGWNKAGQLAFSHVESGCEYTVWLSAPAAMTQFGAICDDYYNCQVGTNVIVNDDRWRKATDPWNVTGGTIEDYRTLIINHETGHRLGFYDDPICPAPGQLAPVMMQQSIDLKGCTFNIWPLPSELAPLHTGG